MSEATSRHEPLLQVKDLNIIYGNSGWRKKGFHALRDVSIDVGARDRRARRRVRIRKDNAGPGGAGPRGRQ